MSVARRKGPAGAADRLCARIVRLRGCCQRCHAVTSLQCAHIISRRFVGDPDGLHLRTNPANCWLLCDSCHRLTAQWPDEHMTLVERTIGLTAYHEMKRVALSPHRRWTVRDWEQARDALRRILEQCGAAHTTDGP